MATAPNRFFASKRTSPPVQPSVVETVDYEIVHQIPGRVRFRIPRASHDAKFARRLVDSVTTVPNVNHARVNRDSASLVVDFQQAHDAASLCGNGNGDGMGGSANVTSELIERIRQAANARVAREITSATSTPLASQVATAVRTAAANASPAEGLPPFDKPIRYVQHLGIPALALGLGAATAVGVAIPGIVVGAAVLAATVPHARRAWQGLRQEKRLTVEVLDVTASVMLVAQSSFLPPAIMVGIIEAAEVVRMWTARRGRQAGFDFLVSPDCPVLVERANGPERAPAQSIEPEDIIFVSSGETIPVDGIVLEGSAWIDQRPLTGDAEPVTRLDGDVVYAATKVLDGKLRILTTHVGTETLAAATIALMDAAPKRDSRVSNWARKTGNFAVVPTLAIGGAVGAASGSIARATGIVSLDFGLGMRVSTPIAILSSQAHAKRLGILFRSGRAVESMGQIDTILFSANVSRAIGSETIMALRDLEIDPKKIHAQLVPEQRAELVKALQENGKKVAVVGDGINDAAAMAQADVAVALGSASDIARETADVVLLNNELRDLAQAIEISQHAMRILKQNQKIVVGGNATGIAYGVITVLNPIAGVLLNNGITLVASLNSLRRPATSERTGMSEKKVARKKQRTNQHKSESV